MATFEIRISETGHTSIRVKVRLKGRSPEFATFSRMTDAKRWAHSTEAAIREGRHFKTAEAKRHTLEEVIDRYLKEVLPLHPRNASNTKRHLAWWKSQLGSLLLSDIGPAKVVESRTLLQTEPIQTGKSKGKLKSNATVLRYLASLSHAYTIAMKDWAWVDDNPVLKISKPRAARGRERYLSDAERQALLAACKQSTSKFLHPVVVLAISTGMRRGEIMNLRWSDVDMQRGQIILTKTKNDTSRALPLVGLAKELLQKIHDSHPAANAYIFYGNDPQKFVDLTQPWKTALARAKLTDFRFHDLRHTTASYLAMNGATTMEIAAVLGHKTLAMVKRYSHLANSHTSKVVTAMNDKIFGQAA